MTARLQIQEHGAETHVTISGPVSETTDLEALAREVRGSRVVFQLAGVTRYNSLGVRNWLFMMAALRERSVEIVLTHCSAAVVQQASMIRGFEGGGVMTSIHVPYLCATCHREDMRLIELHQGASVTETAPCPGCGGVMEIDDLPEIYLRAGQGF